MGYYNEWPAYVSVAERKQKAANHLRELQKKGQKPNPVVIEGRKIANTFWGQAWCDNLEAYSDFSNRLPRGRSYVKNGAVIDLSIHKGSVSAKVMGSSLYTVKVVIEPMPESKWRSLVKACAGKIESLIELLQGKFSQAVMEKMTERKNGLFPKPNEIKMTCSCPDWAGVCKHVAAVMYGIGARLDASPEGLFMLRDVDHGDLIVAATSLGSLTDTQPQGNVLIESDLSSIFGIDIESEEQQLIIEKPKKAPRKPPKETPKIEEPKEKPAPAKKVALRRIMPRTK